MDTAEAGGFADFPRRDHFAGEAKRVSITTPNSTHRDMALAAIGARGFSQCTCLPAAEAEEMMKAAGASPHAMQGSLPAGWLTFAGRENPLDRDERFQNFMFILLS